MLTTRLRTIIFLVIMILTATSCMPSVAPTQPVCSEITMLRQWIHQEGASKFWPGKVADSYDIPTDNISTNSVGANGDELLQWKQDELWYSLVLQNDTVTNIGMQTDQLTAAEAIACLGQPERYSARYSGTSEGGAQLDFSLVFPTQGVLAGGARLFVFEPQQPPTITGGFRLTSIWFGEPGSTEAVLRQAHTVYAPELAMKLIQSYKPWTGIWSDVEVVPFNSSN